MKITFKWLLFLLFELLFVAVIPLVIVYVGYGSWGQEAEGFKVHFGIIIALIVVFFIVKRVLLTPWLDKQKIKAGNLEAQLEAENDKGKIENIESALKRARLIETVITWILPLAFLLVAFMASRAMEQALVTFSGILGFVGVSEIIGAVFSIGRALSVDSKHKNK